jgi:paraquat-inducible protein B
MKAITVSVVFLLTLFCCASITANAQSDRGSIVGTVKDPNGAVVSKAKVTVTSLDSGEVREVETSDDGNYTVAELKAAPYKMTVQATGFKTATSRSR